MVRKNRASSKTIYLNSDTETNKDYERREKKIINVAKKLKVTQSGAVRAMIDAYTE